MKNLFFWFLAVLIPMFVFGCGSPPLAAPEQMAEHVEQETVSPATAVVVDNFSNSPLAPPTPVATKIIEETQPVPEVVPTLSGLFPSGPKVIYSENIHDGTVTFWAASPSNPAYRTPLVKGSDPNDFGTYAALSPDGKMIAYTALPEWNYDNRLAANLWLVTTNGDDPRLLAEGVDIGGPGYPYWSPDSRYIAFVRSTETEDIYSTTIWMIDVQTGKETILVQPEPHDYIWPFGWSKDGDGVYYKHISGTEYIVKYFSLKKNASNSVIPLSIFTKRCDLSPSSTQLLCTVLVDRQNDKYDLTIFPLQGKESSEVVRQFQGENFTSIWGPQNQSITISENLSSAENTTLQIVETDTKTAVDVSLQSADSYLPRSWSPDGTWLATQSVSESHGDLHFLSNNGQTVNHLPTQGATDVLGWLTTDLSSK